MSRLGPHARAYLLHAARIAISRAIGAQHHNRQAEIEPAEVRVRAGAFVTLHAYEELRGCIGYPSPEFPLAETIERCAVSAALSDPRFPPLSIDEWPAITLEISVLGPIERVADLADVEIGRHGLIVDWGSRRGLLLPQVAVEWKWDAEKFAAHTCAKAGLPKGAWRNGAALFKFEAEVFGETVDSR